MNAEEVNNHLIYIAPCGIGLGHTYRTLSIAKRLKSLLPSVELIFSTYGESVSLIEKHGYRCLIERSVSYALNDEGEIDLRLTLAKGPRNIYNFLRQVGDEIYFQTILKPNLVLSDSRLSSVIAARVRKCPSFLIINQLKVILPFKKAKRAKSILERSLLGVLDVSWSYAERIFIPDFPPPYTVSKGNIPVDNELDLWDKIVFTGPLLPVWPEDLPDKDVIKSNLGLEDKHVVLASFSGLKEEKEHLFSYLIKSIEKCKEKLKKRNIVIIVSKGNSSHSSRLRNIGKEDEVIYVEEWLDNKHALLKASDLVITHGGHTSVLEALVYGVPAIHLINPGHTERYLNASSTEELGVAEVLIASNRNNSLCKLLIKLIEDQNMAKKAKEISSYLSTYKGDLLIAETIAKKVNEV